MINFVGVKDAKICILSNQAFESSKYIVVELQQELKNISPETLILNYIFRDGKIISKNNKNGKKLKVAFVSNYGTKCGIGTYSKFLYDELINLVGDYKLFIEKQDSYEIENPIIADDKIIPCWKRGESLLELIKEIKKYDPDIISIQHEFGLFANSGYFLSLLTQLSKYRIIITMHSVFYHLDKVICEAAMPEIIVHLDGAKDVLLNEKKISSKVYVVPHGCFTHSDKTRLWNFYRTDHTIIQAGFLFKYKGWEEALKTVSILKKKYKDVFLTGLCSESDSNKLEHQLYFESLLKLTEELGIQDNVALIRGYQSEKVWDVYFRTNKVAMFPYASEKKDEVFGASGSARIAMSKGIPVVSSCANHFSDMPTIKANTPEELASEIDKLFSDPKLINKQIQLQDKFLEDNSWKNIAEKYLEIFEK